MKDKRQPGRIWSQFKGSLTPQQIADGMAVAQRNALRLLDDAKLLLQARRFPSAAFLCIIAIEEYGKLPVLDTMAYTLPEKLKERWQAYRSHRSKNARWVMPDFVDSGPKSIEELASVTDAEGAHTQLLDELKQLCLYTECLEQIKWSEPSSFTTEEMARGLFAAAERLSVRCWSQLLGLQPT
jgi:AbiV family abortive infection protein